MNFAMISTDTYLRSISIALFVQSMTWSFTDSFPEKAEHLSPWDDDWFRRRTTWNPYEWYKVTTKSPIQIYNRYNTTSGAPPVFWIIVGATFILILLAYLVKFVCSHMDDDDNNDTRAVLHPPPTVVLPPLQTTNQETMFQTPPQGTRNANPVSLGGGLYDHQAPAAHPPYGVGDTPPGYTDVVMADFVEEMKYPEVAQRPGNSPPPKYEDGNLPKY